MWVDKPEEKDDSQPVDSLTNPSVGAGAGGGAQIQSSTTPITGTPSSINPTSQAPHQQFGTIQDYFKGSKSQGEQLGEQFATRLADTQQKQKSSIDETATQTQADIAANTVDFDEGLVSTAVSDPTKVAGNEDQFNKFLSQWNAAYKGPESFESTPQYNTAAQTAQKAKEKASQLESTGGRQQLIQDEFGVYGQGNKGLDEALLQQSSYFPKVQDQAKGFSSIQDYFTKQSKDLSEKAQTAKQTTDQTKLQTQQAFTGNLGKFQTDLNARTKAAQDQAVAKTTAYQTALASGDAATVESALKTAGVPENEVKNIAAYLQSINKDYSSKPSLSRHYDFNPLTAINPTTVATPEDYAKAEAYQKLTGVNYGGVLDPQNKERAGLVPTAESGFNSPNLTEYLKTNLAEQDRALLSKDLRVDNPATRKPADNLERDTDRYLNAAQRTGTTPLSVPAIKRLYDAAVTAYTGGLRGGLPAAHADLTAYANIIKKIQGTTPAINQPVTPTKKPDVQVPENVSNPKPQVNPGIDSSAPVDYGAPINIVTRGIPDATNRSGNIVTPVQPGTLIEAKPIAGVSDQSIDQAITSKIDTLKRTDPRNYTNSMPQINSDKTVMKDLYNQYISKSITPQNYVQLQTLLKKYGLIK